MKTAKRSEKEINDVLDTCIEFEETGVSIAPGMTYEQGIRAGIEWILGYHDNHPLD